MQEAVAPTERYHAEITDWRLHGASEAQLQQYSTDPNCIEMEEWARILADRKAKRDAARVALLDNPFDPRTEISADAKHIAGRIVTHMWVLFVLLPFIVGVLLAIVGVIK